MGGFFGHLTSISDKYFGGSEDGILKDFTPKAIEKAQNIMKDRITTEVPKKGKVKMCLLLKTMVFIYTISQGKVK